MRPPRAAIIFSCTCSDPPEAAMARALVAGAGKVADAVGRYPDAYMHMGGGRIEAEDTPEFVEAVRKDMAAHDGRASVVYRWGEDAGAFETIVAVARGARIAVVWLGDVEHAQVVEHAQRLLAASE